MDELRTTLVVGICSVLVIGAIVGGFPYTVQNTNAQYYSAMNNCIQHGGTFVPGKGNSEAACVIH